MKIKKTKTAIAVEVISYILLVFAVAFCIFPLWLIVSGSFSQNDDLLRFGYTLIPKNFSVEAYKTLFKYPDRLLQAYWTTIVITCIGTLTGLLTITMTSYVIQRKDFKYRNTVSFMIYFTTIFGGGLVPWYILLTKYLHLTNNYLARIFPLLMTPFLIILMRTFIQASVPMEIIESAKIDGAGDFKIYTNIVLPVLGPGLATVGLFLALSYWNDWYNTSLFITKSEMFSLQYYLYETLNSIKFAQEMAAQTGTVLAEEVPTEALKMAMVVVVTGPIIFLYPFVQRYFVSGITIGAVKG